MGLAVNVDVALHRAGEWHLIVRGNAEDHAAGMLSLVGGTLETASPLDEALEATARREVLEEVGVELGSPLHYVESAVFHLADGSPVLNVVFLGELDDGQTPWRAAPDEVSAVVTRTLPELEADPDCPPWTVRSIRLASAARDHRPA